MGDIPAPAFFVVLIVVCVEASIDAVIDLISIPL